MLDYFKYIFIEFDELVGDCVYVDDKVIVGGIVCFEGCLVMVIGY